MYRVCAIIMHQQLLIIDLLSIDIDMHSLKKRTRKEKLTDYRNIDKGERYFSEHSFYDIISSSLLKLKGLILRQEYPQSKAPVEDMKRSSLHHTPRPIKHTTSESFKENIQLLRSGLSPYNLSQRRWGLRQKKQKQDRQDILDLAIERRIQADFQQNCKEEKISAKKVKIQFGNQQFWDQLEDKQQKLVETLKISFEQMSKKQAERDEILLQQKIKEQKRELVKVLLKETQKDVNLSPIETESSVTECNERNISICIQNIAEIKQKRHSSKEEQALQHKFVYDCEKPELNQATSKEDNTPIDDPLSKKVESNIQKKVQSEGIAKVYPIDYNPFKSDIKSNDKPVNLMDFIQKHSKQQSSPFAFTSSNLSNHNTNPFNYSNNPNSIPQNNHIQNPQYNTNPSLSDKSPYLNNLSSSSSNPLYQPTKQSMFQQFYQPTSQSTPSNHHLIPSNQSSTTNPNNNQQRFSYLDSFTKDNKNIGQLFKNGSSTPSVNVRLFDESGSEARTQKKTNLSNVKRRGKKKEIRICS